MRTHRHDKHWVDREEKKVYSRGLCGEDTWVEEITDIESFYFKQALEESVMSSMTAFQTHLSKSLINDNPSSEPSTCEECEALFGFKVLGELP